MSNNSKVHESANTPANALCVKVFGYLQVADYVAAEQTARKAIKLLPNNAAALALYAMALRGIGRFGEAEKQAQKALDLEPENPAIIFVSALCHWSSGAPQEADLAFKKAIGLAPKRSDMRLDYAGFLFHQQRFDETLEQVKLATSSSPEHPKAEILRRASESHIWTPDADILAFRPPLPLAADKPATYVTMGNDYYASSYYDLALDECSRALDIDPKNADAKSLFATAFYMSENDFAAWCKEFRQRLFTPLYASIVILLPAIIFVGGCLYFSSVDNTLATTAVAAAGLIDLLIVIILRHKGGQRLSPQEFDSLVALHGLTPQGRVVKQRVLIGDLDEEHAMQAPQTKQENAAELSLNAGAGQDSARVRSQLQAKAQKLRTTSITYSAVAVVTFVILTLSVILQRAIDIPIHRYIPDIMKYSCLATVVFAGIALWFRHRASEVSNRF